MYRGQEGGGGGWGWSRLTAREDGGSVRINGEEIQM